jgi:glycosyltransferase involved in cell wall biosynthesis
MIHVLVTLFNTGHVFGRCYASLTAQKSKFKCYVVDDCSTDDSAQVAESLTCFDTRFIVIRNQKKLYQSGCYDFLMNEMEIRDEDVCVAVDSDDYLLGTDVFDLVKEQYDRGCVLTHGTFVRTSGGIATQLVPPYDLTRLRRYPDVPSHLRTWKAWLWRKMPADVLKAPNGYYWRAAGDLAFMYTMMEMSGGRIGFISKPVYCYDDTLPTCNHNRNPGIQKHNDHIIRSRCSLPKLY